MSGSLRSLGPLEGAVAYSPVQHVLLRGVIGGGTATGTDTRDSITQPALFRTRQWEASLGTYWRPGPAVLLGGFAGYGRGRGAHDYLRRSGQRGVWFQPGPDSVWAYRYEAQYRRLFAEAYVHWRTEPFFSGGASYRINHVRFSRYTNDGAAIGFRQMWRHEPVVFLRMGEEEGLEDWIAGQLSLGCTFAPGFHTPTERAGNRDLAEARKTLPFVTVSVMLRPHQIWRRFQSR
ncbi:hypothetical protein DLM85_20405 [Hymenobacter edaphi]|uniref:DUF2490 domain-containing protein n=2 Tax=Hymenobacter edaphi TaxID=2211146 RepID=A0A328B8Z2_9BACT|nr:hypothetical protein DLM85_20405 [Hymenobacter edaphi]